LVSRFARILINPGLLPRQYSSCRVLSHDRSTHEPTRNQADTSLLRNAEDSVRLNESTRSAARHKELTLRGILLGIVITLAFTAANAYFGLKAGLTFATSIPAAVISMAILRRFQGSSIQENNIVQTVASAAGTLSSIIFVLPGLVMIGWWSGFPYLTTFLICAGGGVLGVMYTVPLRRALVTNSDLPYPEGLACAEVLRVGDRGPSELSSGGQSANHAGLLAIVVGAISSAAFFVLVATQLFASDVFQYFRIGNRGAASGYDFNLSFALFAVGHLVGLWVGIANALGALIAWGVVIPYLTSVHPIAGNTADVVDAVWSQQVRFFGAGTIGVASIWTLLKLLKPVVSGLHGAMQAARLRKAGRADLLPRTEQDLPIGLVGFITLGCLLPIGWLLARFSQTSGLGHQGFLLVAGGVVFVALMSFFVAVVCGYMAGLIGSSNSPLSGVGILVVIGAAVPLAMFAQPLLPPSAAPALVAYALLVTAVVFAVATISNDNLQDLKTGQLVDATPWRQQVALVIGVLVGAMILPPVLDLLNHAFGFAGAPGVTSVHALAAPQAALISALARGVIRGNLNWSLICAGAVLGVAAIVLDELLRRTTRAHLSPLAVGLGVYLPTSTTLIITVGAVAGWLFERRTARTVHAEGTRHLGILLASGMLVGEGLMGVVLAAVIVFSGKPAPLALVGAEFATASQWLGGAAFVLFMLALYLWIARLGARTETRTVQT
jgi:putative OPT family oligopeptide transporter